MVRGVRGSSAKRRAAWAEKCWGAGFARAIATGALSRGSRRCVSSHREALPTGTDTGASITERPVAPADFPEARQRLDIFDGCPNQFAYGDNIHQIAVWRAKTARWAKHRLAEGSDAAAAISVAAAAAAAECSDTAMSAAASARDSRVSAKDRCVPNVSFNLFTASTNHRLSVAAAAATLKLTASAHATATATKAFLAAVVLSPDAAAAAATAAAATHRLAGVATKAKSAAATAVAASASISSLQAVLSSAASATSAALAAAAIAAAASAATSSAFGPFDQVGGLPASPASAATAAAAPSLDGIVCVWPSSWSNTMERAAVTATQTRQCWRSSMRLSTS